jgi:predicted CXXCH cytochrome family protein
MESDSAMKTLRKAGPWVLTGAAVLLGVLITALVGVAQDQDQLPAYLKDATYITSAKCKLCHKTRYNLWAETQHAKNAETGCPAPAEGEAPSAEMLYRYVTGFNSADSTYAEKGTACEACHGPGSAHFAAKTDQRKATIVNPDNLATPGQKFSLCGRCHGQYSIGDKRYADGFLPGVDLFKIDGFKLDPVVPDKPLQQLNEISGSKHFANGVVCITCHLAHSENAQEHQLRKPIIELCTDCHKDKTMAAHAPEAAAGDTCATCHMPKGQHLFTKPAPAP